MGVEKGRAFGMPVDQFTELAFDALVAGNDQIIIGDLGPPGAVELAGLYKDIVPKRRTAFEILSKLMRGH